LTGFVLCVWAVYEAHRGPDAPELAITRVHHKASVEESGGDEGVTWWSRACNIDREAIIFLDNTDAEVLWTKCGALPPTPQTLESFAVVLHRVRLGQATDLHHRHCCAHRAPCVNGCRRHCLSDSWFELSRGDIEHGSPRGPYCSRRLANRIAGLAGASGPLVGSLGRSSSANIAGLYLHTVHRNSAELANPATCTGCKYHCHSAV
jgi:hypothetical protein